MQSATKLRRAIAIIFVATAALTVQQATAQLPFFSGAEGFGGGSVPSSGWLSTATVYHVTNLNDSGAGSFRNAFVQNSSNKIIVFDVAGTIQLGTSTLDIKNLSNYYIAGQTAPGPVTIYGNTTQITHSNNRVNSNVILRYLTFRKGTAGSEDSITFSGGDGPDANFQSGSNVGKHMILDHVSASWSEDEILSVANNNTDITVQYSNIHDALVSNHAYGSLIRPKIDSNVSFHHNLYANNASRQARFGTYYYNYLEPDGQATKSTIDFRNNVVYNWRDRASYAGGSNLNDGPEYTDVNFVGNYFIAGPGTGSNTTKAFYVDQNTTAKVYQSGNFIDSDKQLNPGGQPNGANTGWNMFQPNGGSLDQQGSPLATSPVTTQSASDAYWQVVNHAGNWWWNRDAIDSRVNGNVLNNTNAPGGIGAAAPPAGELNPLLSAPMLTHPGNYDADGDGMKDEWETRHGGNLVWNADFDNDGYINLIEYINEVGEFPAPAPIVFNGATNNRYAQITNWKTNDGGATAGSNWQPSKYDETQINSGTVVVDSVGQNAGLLVLGANAGNVATLNVSGGWLEVHDQIVIGAHATSTGTLNLSGGALRTGALSKGTGDAFNFTGGTLDADTVNFTLANNGGTIAPGYLTRQTHVVGGLSLSSSSAVQIDLDSLATFDKLLVDGSVMLGGSLNVVPKPGFTPVTGNSWQIITAGGIDGVFASITAGYSVQEQGNNLFLYFGSPPPPVLAGDYNDDGIVDAADYVVWRKAMAGGLTLANETASSGTVDEEDFDEWQTNLGATSEGEGGGQASVPEPLTVYMALLALTAIFGIPNRHRRLRVSGSFLQKRLLG